VEADEQRAIALDQPAASLDTLGEPAARRLILLPGNHGNFLPTH
jgi:hypothetical protein